jgi:hypothetical protein
MGINVCSVLSNQAIVECFGFIDDEAWGILNTAAKELDLDCLRFVYFAGDCTFNYDQVKHILNIEIPALRNCHFNKKGIEALDIIEKASKAVCQKSFVYYLFFYGD